MWQCRTCEPLNEDQKKFCIVCNSAREYIESADSREKVMVPKYCLECKPEHKTTNEFMDYRMSSSEIEPVYIQKAIHTFTNAGGRTFNANGMNIYCAIR